MATYSDIINGLKLFASHQEDGEEEPLGGADHDIIFGPCTEEIEMSDEEKKQLEKWGWFCSKEHHCWCHYV